MLYTKEVVHSSRSTSEKFYFSDSILKCKTFAEAGLNQGGYCVLPDDFYVQRTGRRGYHVFVFTLSGHGHYTMEDGTEFEVSPEQCFISWSQGQSHMERTAPGEIWEFVWFTMLEENSRFYPSNDDYDIIQFTGGEKLKEIMDKLKEEDLLNDSISPSAMELYEELFLLSAKRALGWSDRGPVSRNMEILAELWKKVAENTEKAWTVKELSKEAGISRTHLNRLCLQLYHTSPGNRVRDMKLTQAKVLLRNSGMSIGEISDQLGFSSISIFSHAFREYFGVSPRDFRKDSVTGDK